MSTKTTAVRLFDIDDIPHRMERLLREHAADHRVAAPDEGPAVYRFDGTDRDGDEFIILTSVTVCPPPVTFSLFGIRFSPHSGSHRIVFDARMRGERFVVVVEEREDHNCNHVGEIITIGAATEAGGQRIAEGGLPFARELLGAMIFAAIGIRAELPENIPVYDDPIPGLEHQLRFHLVDRFTLVAAESAQLIANAGCQLSSGAQGCTIFSLF